MKSTDTRAICGGHSLPTRPFLFRATGTSLTRALATLLAPAAALLLSNGGMSATAAASTNYGLPTYQVSSFGASGSSATFSCSGQAGQTTLTCTAGATDFVAGQGIRIVGGGAASAAPAIAAAPVITPYYPSKQTSGPHSNCYFVVSADPFGGISAPSPVACAHNQAATSYSGTQNLLSTGSNDYRDAGPSISFLWYVSQDGAPYQLVSVSPYQDEADDEGQRIGSTNGWPNNFSVTAPSVSKPEDLFATVVSVSGPQITISSPLVSAVNSQVVAHDDTNSIQQAINAAVANGGGVIQLGVGTFNIGRPSFQYFPGGSIAYPPYSTNLSLDVWYLPFSYLYIPNGAVGNIFLQGSGSGTVMNTPPEHGNAHFLSVGSFERPDTVPQGAIGILPVDKGSTTVTLTSPAAASQFQPGSDVWLFSGSFDGSPCIDNSGAGTAGGQCHFSELNTVASVQGTTLTLANPTSKRFYDDGSSSYGIVKLPVTPHNVAIQAMTINTYDAITGTGLLYGFLVNGVTINGSPTPGPFGGGYKRDVLIENSTWTFGGCSSAAAGVDEFDQFTNLAFVSDKITGCSAAGTEGISYQAMIHATEGASQITVANSQFTNASLYIDQTTDDTIAGNYFHNGIIQAGNTYQPVYNAVQSSVDQDQSFLSFNSQVNLMVQNNTFVEDSTYNPDWVIKVGHFTSATVDSNTMKVGTTANMFALISHGGAVTNNSISLPLFSKARSVVLEADEAPGILPASFFMTANSVAGGYNSLYFLAAPGFTDAAPVCIEGNRYQGWLSNLFFPQGLQGTILSCDPTALTAGGISPSIMSQY